MRSHTTSHVNFGPAIGIGAVAATGLGLLAFGPVGLLLGAGALAGGLIGRKVETERMGRELGEDGDDDAHDQVISEMRAQGRRSGIVRTEFDYGDPAPLNPFYTTKVRRTTHWSDED